MVEISIRPNSNALFRDVFEIVKEILEYDFYMNDLKRFKILNVNNKLMHHRSLAGQIIENSRNAPWVNGESIYKLTVKFDIANGNTLRYTNARLVVSLILKLS